MQAFGISFHHRSSMSDLPHKASHCGLLLTCSWLTWKASRRHSIRARSPSAGIQSAAMASELIVELLLGSIYGVLRTAVLSPRPLTSIINWLSTIRSSIRGSIHSRVTSYRWMLHRTSYPGRVLVLALALAIVFLLDNARPVALSRFCHPKSLSG